MNFYKRIQQRREDLKMSQDELAEKVGYTSRSTISKLEAGKIDIPLSKLSDFAKALKTTEEYLMGWENETQAAYSSSKKTELKNLIDSNNIPEDKIDLLIGMIKSWS